MKSGLSRFGQGPESTASPPSEIPPGGPGLRALADLNDRSWRFERMAAFHPLRKFSSVFSMTGVDPNRSKLDLPLSIIDSPSWHPASCSALSQSVLNSLHSARLTGARLRSNHSTRNTTQIRWGMRTRSSSSAKRKLGHESWEHTGEELIGGAEITSDVILAPEIEMPWESDKVERIISMPNYATAPATGHKG